MSFDMKRCLALALVTASAAACGTGQTVPGDTRQVQALTDASSGTVTDLAATGAMSPAATSLPSTAPAASTSPQPSASASPTTDDWDAFLKALGLSADQRTRADALKATLPQEDWAARHQEFAALVGGDTVNRSALERFLRRQLDERATRMKAKIDVLVSFRSLLTPEQRQKAVQLILERLAMHDGDHDKATGAQASAAMPASPPVTASPPATVTPPSPSPSASDGATCMPHGHWHGHGGMGAAVASFLLTGDRPALEQALAGTRTTDERVKAMADTIMAMTKAERQELVKMMQTASTHKHRQVADAEEPGVEPQLGETPGA